MLLVAIGCAVIFLLFLFHGRHEPPTANDAARKAVPTDSDVSFSRGSRDFSRHRPGAIRPQTAETPEQLVSEKVKQFAQKRRDLARRLAKSQNREVSSEAEAFFDAVESGNWDDIHARWKALADRSGQYTGSKEKPARDADWPEILDTYGVAEQAHMWPAQKLLDYGNAVLGSMKPGMIYVGGTDPGRWVPELLNETGEGDPHIIITQNALADATYLDFVNTLYGDQISSLTSEDSQKAFQQYTQDAQKRLEHDQQFPDEPKQLLPGEDVSNANGHTSVSGQVAVMLINEKLMQALMQKNPSLSFAMEESFPMKGFYADAAPLGPLMELNASSGQGAWTPEQAAQSLDYWKSTTAALQADPEAAGSDATLKTWSHDAVAAANLLSAHGYGAEAEQAYRYSAQLWPASPEAVNGLAQVLAENGRASEANQLLTDFVSKYPNERAAIEKARSAWSVSVPNKQL
jgi:TolA-binding protein